MQPLRVSPGPAVQSTGRQQLSGPTATEGGDAAADAGASPLHAPSNGESSSRGADTDTSGGRIFHADKQNGSGRVSSSGNDGGEAPSSEFLRGIVLPVVVAVAGAAVLAAAIATAAVLMRRWQRRRQSFQVISSGGQPVEKSGSPPSPDDRELPAAPPLATCTGQVKVSGTPDRCSRTDRTQSATQLAVRCFQPSINSPTGDLNKGTFTFPSLTPRAAAAAEAMSASAAGGTAGGPYPAIPCAAPAAASLRASTSLTGEYAPGGTRLRMHSRDAGSSVECTGMFGGAEGNMDKQLPPAPDSPVLGLQPLQAASELCSQPASRGPEGQTYGLGLSIELPRWDSGTSGATNVSHVAQMSPSCSIFAGGTLEASGES